MRVAYVCADPGVPVFGQKGCSIHVQEVIRALIAHGAHVDLFATRTEGTPQPGLESVRLHTLPDPRGSDAKARERAAMLANVPLRSALASAGPFEMLYERYSLWSVEALRHARARGIPSVLEVNAPLIEEQAEHRILCDRANATLVAKAAFEAAHSIIAVSKDVAEYVQRFIGPTDKVHVVPNGVDPARFVASPAPRRRKSDASFTIGFVGSLKPWHGLATLAEAFADLYKEDAQTRLLIVGDGPERARIDAWLTECQLSDGVRFTGPVEPARIPSVLASMDAAVAPYAARENFYFSPLKVLEYMGAGLPVVASRLGQLEELIADGKTGLLCAPDDPRDLATQLRRLRDDEALRERLGSAARSVVVERHTWQAVTSRILATAGLDVEARG